MSEWSFDAPLPADAVGTTFVPTALSGEAASGKSVGLSPKTSLKIGGHAVRFPDPIRYSPDQRRDAIAFHAEGTQSIVQVSDRCTRLDMLTPTASLQDAPGGFGAIGGFAPDYVVDAGTPI